MKFKHVVSVSTLFLVIMLLVGGNEAYAKLDTEIDTISGPEFYILTYECPEGYIEYASNNVVRYLTAVDPSELESLPQDGVIRMGTPFSFANEDADVFYFPIFCNDELIYTLRVCPKMDGGYGGVLSGALVKELRQLYSGSSEQATVRLLMEDTSIVAYLNGSKIVLAEYPKTSDTLVEDMITEKLSDSNAFEENSGVQKKDLVAVDITKDSFGFGIQTDVSSLGVDFVDPHWAIPVYKYLGSTSHQQAIPWIWSKQ